MITANATYVFFEGSEVKYGSTSIYVDFKYNNRSETYLCELQALGAAANAPNIGEYYTTVTKAAVDAKTGTGTETEAVLEAVELVIIDYLDAITENSSVTFTN